MDSSFRTRFDTINLGWFIVHNIWVFIVFPIFLLMLTHLSRMEVPSLINWTSPFPFQGMLGGIFYTYSNFNRTLCRQTVENLIRCRVFQGLIWFCTVCRCPTKKDTRLIWVKEKLTLPHDGIISQLITKDHLLEI